MLKVILCPILASVAVCCGLCTPCSAMNPQGGGYQWNATIVSGGVPYQLGGTLAVTSSLWITTDTPWDGLNTSRGNPYSHGIPVPDFPITVGTRTISAANSDAYWDAYYGVANISTSTFSQNCHGFSTGKGNWVQPNSTGMGVVLADEWTEVAGTNTITVGAIVVAEDLSHSIIVDAGCDDTSEYSTIKQTREKNGSSGVYKLVYACPGGTSATATIYVQD